MDNSRVLLLLSTPNPSYLKNTINREQYQTDIHTASKQTDRKINQRYTPSKSTTRPSRPPRQLHVTKENIILQ